MKLIFPRVITQSLITRAAPSGTKNIVIISIQEGEHILSAYTSYITVKKPTQHLQQKTHNQHAHHPSVCVLQES